MKKLFTVDDLLVCLCSAVGYGLGYNLPMTFGCSVLISLLICLVAGALFDYAANALIKKQIFQKTPALKFLLGAVFLAVYLVGDSVSVRIAGRSLFSSYLEELFYVVGIPVLGFVFSLIANQYKKKKIRERYGTGEAGFVSDKDTVTYFQAMNGVNREITDKYDEALSVRTKTGVYVGVKEKNVLRFLGIPYADAPRFLAPVPRESSGRVYEAKFHGPSPVQPINERNAIGYHRQDENCLTLDITVPAKKKKSSSPKSVIVSPMISDFNCGGIVSPVLDGRNLVKESGDIVYVAVNHRIGPFGFLDLSALPDGDRYPDAPNLGLLDIICALRWIRENIEAFGGDPHNITVLGTGSGGLASVVLSRNPEFRALFSKAFILSDYTGMLCTRKDLQNEAEALRKHLNVQTASEIAAADVSSIRDFSADPNNFIGGICSGVYPVPEDLFAAPPDAKDGKLSVVLCSAKSQTGEWILWDGLENSVRYGFSGLSDALRKTNPPAGALLDRLDSMEKKVDLIENVLFHGRTLKLAESFLESGDKVYVFCSDTTPEVAMFGSNSVETACSFLGNTNTAEELGVLIDKSSSQILQTMLCNFVRTSDPSIDYNDVKNTDPIPWPLFDGTDGSVMTATDSGIRAGTGTFVADTKKAEALQE